jgi:polyvinyl alcohol dehydrogenase (cytochrome)
MRILRCCIASSCVLFFSCLLFAQDGATIYKSLCASCHDAGVERAPNRESLKAMSAERVLAAMESGAMVPMAGRLSAAERRALAEFLTGKTLGQTIPPPQGICTTGPNQLNDWTASPHWRVGART